MRKTSFSKTPIGPFQRTVFASSKTDKYFSIVFEPMSRPIEFSGMSLTLTELALKVEFMSSAHTTSLGKIILFPLSLVRQECFLLDQSF